MVKLMNEKITLIRRQLFRELTTTLERKAVKDTRRILLNKPENLEKAVRKNSGGMRCYG